MLIVVASTITTTYTDNIINASTNDNIPNTVQHCMVVLYMHCMLYNNSILYSIFEGKDVYTVQRIYFLHNL